MRRSISCAWCSVARRSHSVVVIEVPNAPAVMRAKFETPDADGTRSAGSPWNVIDTIAMKKVAMPMP